MENTTAQAKPIEFTILESALECSVCLSLICEPITISCGHSFCRVCLVTSLRRSKKKCPACRAVCHIAAEDADENIMIKAIAKSLNPALYATREVEFAEVKASWSALLPIFYYNVPMFPGEILSLHLFEPRYKIMMQRVVDTSRSFAYVPNFTSYCASPGDVALIAQLKEVEFLADGRCMIEAVLSGRHRIIDHYVEQGTHGLHFCRLQLLEDDPPDNEEEIAQINTLKATAVTLLDTILESALKDRVYQHYGPPPGNIVSFSLWLAAVTPLSAPAKTALLGSTNTLDRLATCVSGLQVMFNRVSQQAISRYPTSVPRAQTQLASAAPAGAAPPAAAGGAGRALSHREITGGDVELEGHVEEPEDDEEDEEDDDDDDEAEDEEDEGKC